MSWPTLNTLGIAYMAIFIFNYKNFYNITGRPRLNWSLHEIEFHLTNFEDIALT